MARGQTLISLLNDLRAVARMSLNPAHSAQVRDHQVQALQRAQNWLWTDFDWPHLRVQRDVPCQAGQRFYGPPEDLTIDRIVKVQVRYGWKWVDLEPFIDTEANYAQWDSDLGVRSWPIRRWRIYEGEQLEMWPIPDHDADVNGSLDGMLRIHGIRNLRPLVADTDTCDLDARLIVMFAAAEMLAASGAKDAELKLRDANAHYAKLRGDLMPRRRFRMFGRDDSARTLLRGPPPVYYRVVSGG